VLPWHTCALGKAIVAQVPDPERHALLGGALPVLTGGTVTDPGELTTQLDRVRSTGYAVEDGEATIGDAGVAAPVFATDGVAGAIGVVGPVERLLAPDARDGFAVAVRDTARLLSRDLGAGRSPTRRFGVDTP
jgi:DNA-binding IclR family transcriptional regulator